jgi:hypothetical protein
LQLSQSRLNIVAVAPLFDSSIHIFADLYYLSVDFYHLLPLISHFHPSIPILLGRLWQVHLKHTIYITCQPLTKSLPGLAKERYHEGWLLY